MPNLAQSMQKQPAVLMTVISLDNAKQQGPQWGQFLQRVEQGFQAQEFSKFIIVTTGYLQRHYFSLGLATPLDEATLAEQAKAEDAKWLAKAAAGFKELSAKPEIISWQRLLAQPTPEQSLSFSDFLVKVHEEYATNEHFKALVEHHANHYVHRKIAHYLKKEPMLQAEVFSRAAIDYVLEECAAVQQLFRCGADILFYPGGMNPPASYIWNTYFSHQALVYKSKLPAVSSSLLMPYCEQLLVKVKDWNRRQQTEFIRRCNALVQTIQDHRLTQEDSAPKTALFYRRSV